MKHMAYCVHTLLKKKEYILGSAHHCIKCLGVASLIDYQTLVPGKHDLDV